MRCALLPLLRHARPRARMTATDLATLAPQIHDGMGLELYYN